MKKHLKDYFIPHEGNDFAPHSLQKAAVIGMSVLVVLSFAVSNIQTALWVGSDWLVSTVLPAVIVDLTNDEREDEDLGQLRRNDSLDVAATLKAQHMAENEYFSHYAPDGTTPWHWFGVANYNFVHAGENLAIHFTDSGDVVDAWMDSPTHRANIMKGDFTEIGVGTAEGRYDGYKTIYVVQLFGTPAASAAIPEPVAQPEPAPSHTPTPTPAPIVAAETTVAESEEEVVAVVEEEDNVLAEAVEITETIEVIEPESEPVMVATEPEPVLEPESTTSVSDMEVTDNGVAIYSDHISTTTGGVPATIDTDKVSPQPESGLLGQLATQPHLVLQIIYSIIALFVVGSLLVSILVEIRYQAPVQVAYSVALLIMMFGLYKLHVYISGAAIVV